MRLLPIINFVALIALGSNAAAEAPSDNTPPVSAPATESAQLVPTVTSAKQALQERHSITIRGTMPNEISDGSYQFVTKPQFAKDSKLLQITIAVNAPKSARFKRNPSPFSTTVTVPELKDYKGEFEITVVTPGGKELHRFGSARM